jgi:hypothetical protein
MGKASTSSEGQGRRFLGWTLERHWVLRERREATTTVASDQPDA